MISLLSLRYNPLHRTTLHVLIPSSTSFAQYNNRQGNTVQLRLPELPDFPGADPSRAVLDAFKVSHRECSTPSGS